MYEKSQAQNNRIHVDFGPKLCVVVDEIEYAVCAYPSACMICDQNEIAQGSRTQNH